MIATENIAMVKVGILLSLKFSSGGGISIHFVASENEYPFDNAVQIDSGKFVSNTAQLGGGLAVDVDYENLTTRGCINAGNILLIESCTFDNNIAYGQGSSAYLLNSKSCQTLLNTTISFSNFTNGICSENTGAGLLCLGSLVLSHFPLTLKGTLLFSDNSLSALSLSSSSSIELLPSTDLRFINNNAVDGAAIYIIDCSSIVVNDGTELYFENNKASNRGGAIYAESCSQTSGDCFIKHSNSEITPDEWRTNLTFYENRDTLQKFSYLMFVWNSIYTDSIVSCVWPDFDKNMTFCWKGWSYWRPSSFTDFTLIRDNCHNQLRSGPAYIQNTSLTKYSVYPGQCINLQQFITVYDDWNNDITDQTNLQADLLYGPTRIVSNPNNCQCNYLISNSSDQCTIYMHEFEFPKYRPCMPQEVALLSQCNEDYANQSSQMLVHLPHQLNGIVLELSFKVCDNGSYCTNTTSQLPAGSCLKPDTPYKSVCNEESSFITLNLPCAAAEDTLCGSCAENQGLSIAFNAPQFACMKCDNAFPGVAFYFLEIVLVMAMMTVLAVLHINITNGNLNAYILYSQMITLQFPWLGITAWTSPFPAFSFFKYMYTSIFLSVYSIWNLNFLSLYPNFLCIPNLRSALDVILHQYIVAACPLLFIILSYTWIQCYNNGYRLVVYTTRPVHRLLARFWQKFKIKPSLIDTYAGLLLLVYMRFLAVSVKLLQFITIDRQLSSSPLVSLASTIILATVGTLCLLVFVVLPMMVVLLYPFKIFQRCLTCCRLDRPGLHALVDAYQGCFKNSATDGSEMRFFAGIYLLFRFCMVAVVILVLPLQSSCLLLLLAKLNH